MNPPLRSEKDRAEVIKGLQDGTIDVIATDHAPHSRLEKDQEFDQAANGIIGLETSVSLSLELVRQGLVERSRIVEPKVLLLMLLLLTLKRPTFIQKRILFQKAETLHLLTGNLQVKQF